MFSAPDLPLVPGVSICCLMDCKEGKCKLRRYRASIHPFNIFFEPYAIIVSESINAALCARCWNVVPMNVQHSTPRRNAQEQCAFSTYIWREVSGVAWRWKIDKPISRNGVNVSSLGLRLLILLGAVWEESRTMRLVCAVNKAFEWTLSKQ